MAAMRKSWTDERLDDFAIHVDRRFDAVDKRFDAVDQRFEAVDQRFEAVDRRFDRIETDLRGFRAETNMRFDALQRTLLQIAGGTLATLIAGFAGIIITQL